MIDLLCLNPRDGARFVRDVSSVLEYCPTFERREVCETVAVLKMLCCRHLCVSGGATFEPKPCAKSQGCCCTNYTRRLLNLQLLSPQGQTGTHFWRKSHWFPAFPYRDDGKFQKSALQPQQFTMTICEWLISLQTTIGNSGSATERHGVYSTSVGENGEIDIEGQICGYETF